MSNTTSKPSRLKRYAKRAAIGAGALLGMVVVLVAGLLLSLRFAGVRRLVVARVNGALADSFRGRVQLHGLQSIGLGGIGAADAEVFDPAGQRVLDIHGLDVRLSVPTLAWAALTHKSQPLTVRLNTVSLKHVDVRLLDDGTGSPSLADAFLPKKPSPKSTGPGTIVIIDRALFNHVWVHGAFGSTPPLDVELKDAQGSLRIDDDKTAIAFTQVDLRARGLPAGVDPIGRLRASLDIPAAPNKPLAARAHYQGSAANIPLVLDGSYIDSKIVANLEASDIPPDAVKRQVSALDLRSPASLSVSAQGTLPNIHGNFALGVGAGKVEGDFDASVQDDMTAKATVRTHDFDAAELASNAPASSLNLTLHASARVPKTGPTTGDFALDSGHSVVLAETVPAISLSGTFSSDSKVKRNHVEAHADIAEPGAPTSIDVTAEQARTTTVEFKTETNLDNAPRLKKLAAVSRARGELTSQGTYRVNDSSLNAAVRADLRDLQQGTNRVARAQIQASVAGVLPHPNADVHLDVTDADLSGQHIRSAQVAARGSLSHVALSAEVATRQPERRIQFSGYVSNDHGISVDHPSLNVHQDDTNLRISADGVDIVAGRTRVNGLHLEGAGNADASLVYGPALESANVQTQDLDLARLWHLVDAQAPVRSGKTTILLSYERRAGNPRARLTAHGQDLSFNRVNGASLIADLTLNDGRLDGSANADLKRLGHLNVDFQALRGIDLDNPDPARMTGTVSIEGQVELSDLNQLVPKDTKLPVARALGQIKYDIGIERDHPGPGLPSLHAHVSTKNLQLAGARDSKKNLTTKQEAKDAAPLSIKGLDINIDVSHEETGETELATTITDETGPLVALSVEGKATPHLATLASELESQWREIPLSVKLTVPPRQLEKLPVAVRPADLSGRVSAEFTYDGTLSAPKIKLTGKLDRFRQTLDSTRGLDLAWDAGYDGARAKFAGTARSGNKDVAKADIDCETAINAWLDRTGTATPPLDASAHLDFDGFPIALLPGTSTSQVDGALSGKVALDHFGRDATVDVNLDAASLKVGATPFGKMHAGIQAKGGKAQALLRVDSGQGITTAEAHSGLEWGSRFVPQVQMPAEVQLRAKNLRIGAFSPFVATIFGELEGRINGDLNAHFSGGAPELDGHIDLDDGVAQVASVGQRFDHIKARVSLEPGKAKLEELDARATSGELKVTGEARFTGLDLTGADAHLRIARSQKVALTLAGTEVGEMYGGVDVSLRPTEGQHSNTMTVTVPEMHVRIPDTGSQEVQDLAPAKGVRIGTWQRAGDFVTLPLQPLMGDDPSKNDNPMIVVVDLGTKIEVERGDSTKVSLGGKLRIVLGDPMTMTGQIYLRGGSLDVSGKKFVVESGTVTFTGEPSNPTIVATALWDAADDEKHRVYADFTGSASNGKVTLRAEPPLTQDEILSLLLTGSTDGSLGGGASGGGGSSNAGTAVGAVGGAATQGLNKLLSGISQLDVSTRIDTSTGSARPELVLQISPRVSAQITRALGEPAPGQPPDLTFLTFDFRILQSWSLAALIGDRGESGLDLLWRRRY